MLLSRPGSPSWVLGGLLGLVCLSRHGPDPRSCGPLEIASTAVPQIPTAWNRVTRWRSCGPPLLKGSEVWVAVKEFYFMLP